MIYTRHIQAHIDIYIHIKKLKLQIQSICFIIYLMQIFKYMCATKQRFSFPKICQMYLFICIWYILTSILY